MQFFKKVIIKFIYLNKRKKRFLLWFLPSVREKYRLEQMVGPTGIWDQLQKYQLKFLKQMGLQPWHTLLDIGCGPLSGGLVFIPYLDTGNYTGVDIKEDAIREAKNQIKKAGLNEKKARLIRSDNFAEKELNGQIFNYIFASQILYHLTKDQIIQLFKVLKKITKSGSKFYGDIIGYPNKVTPESKWYEFLFFLHTPNELHEIGDEYEFNMINLGHIEQFGYPKRVELKTNNMLEFVKR